MSCFSTEHLICKTYWTNNLRIQFKILHLVKTNLSPPKTLCWLLIAAKFCMAIQWNRRTHCLIIKVWLDKMWENITLDKCYGYDFLKTNCNFPYVHKTRCHISSPSSHFQEISATSWFVHHIRDEPRGQGVVLLCSGSEAKVDVVVCTMKGRAGPWCHFHLSSRHPLSCRMVPLWSQLSSMSHSGLLLFICKL